MADNSRKIVASILLFANMFLTTVQSSGKFFASYKNVVVTRGIFVNDVLQILKIIILQEPKQ